MYCEVSLVISCFALSPHFHMVSQSLHHQITTMCVLEFYFHLIKRIPLREKSVFVAIREVCFCSHQGLLKDEAAFISCKIFCSGSYHTTWHHILQDSSVHSCCNVTPKSHILNLCSCSSQVIFVPCGA